MRSFLLTLSLFSFKLIYGQSTWEEIADFAGNDRHGAVAFSIDGKGYVGAGGRNAGPVQKDFYRYDPQTDNWSQIADFGGAIFGGGFAVSVDGKGYAGLGFSYDWYQYDPILNTWKEKAGFPYNWCEYPMGFVIGRNIYVTTGIKPSIARREETWMYDTEKDTWTQKADFPGLTYYGGVGFSLNGKGYAGIGTSKNNGNRNELYEYDPLKDTWTQKTLFPNDGVYQGVGFALGNKAYIGTGYDKDNKRVNNFYEYDPMANTWKEILPLPNTTSAGTVAFVAGNYAYCGLGVLNLSFFKLTTDHLVANLASASINASFQLFPNPTSDQLSIQTSRPLQLAIYKMNGELVRRLSIEESTSLSLEFLTAGLYLVKSHDSEGNFLGCIKLSKL